LEPEDGLFTFKSMDSAGTRSVGDCPGRRNQTEAHPSADAQSIGPPGQDQWSDTFAANVQKVARTQYDGKNGALPPNGTQVDVDVQVDSSFTMPLMPLAISAFRRLSTTIWLDVIKAANIIHRQTVQARSLISISPWVEQRTAVTHCLWMP
jgi:hypothetical protein